jgi:4,5-DOPA dioxygenase extradiol
MSRTPVAFVSHGSPMLSIEPHHEVHHFLREFASFFPRPKAILVVSPHWETEAPCVGGADWPETIHDFHGFPKALYDLQYNVPGAPDLARAVKKLLDGAGFATSIDSNRGLDHGVWAPLRLSYPAADIPVVQLSQQSHCPPIYHLAIGRALAPLRDEGVLIYASGTMTHNNRSIDRAGQSPTPPWAQDFVDWIAMRLAERDDAALVDYRQRAPNALMAHPSDDHLLPLYTALGAATPGYAPERIHASFVFSTQAMDAYAFT